MVGHIDQVFKTEVLNEELTYTLRWMVKSVVVAHKHFPEKWSEWSEQKFENLISHDSFATLIGSVIGWLLLILDLIKWLFVFHLVEKRALRNVICFNMRLLWWWHNMSVYIDSLIFQFSHVKLFNILLMNDILELWCNLNFLNFLWSFKHLSSLFNRKWIRILIEVWLNHSFFIRDLK